MGLFNNRVQFEVISYSEVVLLNTLKENNIPIYNFKHLTNDSYQFEVDFLYEKKVLKIYPYASIKLRYGILGRLKNLFHNKITLIAFIIASFLFFDLNSRIYDINIIGTNRRMNAALLEDVTELGLSKGKRKPNFQEILDIENNLKDKYVSSIDFMEVRLSGSIINVKYQMRKETVEVPPKEGAMYAKKNGLISHFVLSSGEKMVEENQYVTEGTLLVSDYIIDSNGNNIYIGAYGQVYAITWTIIEINEKTSLDEVEAFSYAMEKAKHIMCQGFYLEETILKEQILKFNYEKDTMLSLKIHFTCLEDIAN